MFPSTFIETLYLHLKEQHVEFKTYNSLAFDFEWKINSGDELKEAFEREWKIYRNEKLSPDYFQMFLLHDSDSGPRETEKILDLESSLNIVSTTSIFANGFNKGRIEPYRINYQKLVALQDKAGICFSYHCDALTHSQFDVKKAIQIFENDIRFLESYGFSISHFSPHGGIRGPKGESNNSIFWLKHTNRRIVWTHNRFGPSGFRYSDGGLKARLLKSDETLNLRQFLVNNAKTGTRGFVLLHPQYYFAEDSKAAQPYFSGNPWLREVWDLHNAGKMNEYWNRIII